MDPDQLLGAPAVQAAVGALASRNAHHFSAMDEEERTQALEHWRTLALDVLTATRAVLGGEHGPVGGMPADEGGPGRAVIVFEDAGEDDVAVHIAFHPELQELGDDQVAGTAAQLTAMALLQQLAEEGDPGAPG